MGAVRQFLGFSNKNPGGSDSKESSCSAGGLGLIPGLIPGEGNGNPRRIPWTKEPGGLHSIGSKESDTTE